MFGSKPDSLVRSRSLQNKEADETFWKNEVSLGEPQNVVSSSLVENAQQETSPNSNQNEIEKTSLNSETYREEFE